MKKRSIYDSKIRDDEQRAYKPLSIRVSLLVLSDNPLLRDRLELNKIMIPNPKVIHPIYLYTEMLLN